MGEHRAKVESRIRMLEGGAVTKISGTAKQGAKFDKYDNKSEVLEYKAAADVTIPKKRSIDDSDEEEKPVTKKIKVEDVEEVGEKKKKKDKVKEDDADVTADTSMDTSMVEVKSEKKKKKKDKQTAEEVVADTTLDTTADTSAAELSGE